MSETIIPEKTVEVVSDVEIQKPETVEEPVVEAKAEEVKAAPEEVFVQRTVRLAPSSVETFARQLMNESESFKERVSVASTFE